MIIQENSVIIIDMRYKNPPFKKTIRDDLAEKPQTKDEKSEIKVPTPESIKKLWWSKYKPDLKNPSPKKPKEESN
ncbi:MAG: hypothetical protein VX478_04340 [Chloroflexota bacterium]|nr:hypothetical protein [Chloroflexota bacterium]